MSGESVDKSVETYMKLVLHVLASFFGSLANQTMRTATNEIQVATCENVSKKIVSTPIIDMNLLTFVLTQVLPLESILSCASSHEPQKGLEAKYKLVITQLIEERAPHLRECLPNHSYIDAQALTLLAQCHQQVKEYMLASGASEAGGLHAMKELAAVENNLSLYNIAFADTKLVEMTKLVVWILTAFSDWYGVEVVDANDVYGLVQLMLCFESPKDVLTFYGALSGSGTNNADFTKYAQTLQSILQNNELYLTEAALQKLTHLFMYLSTRSQLETSIRKLGQYLTNVTG